MTPLSENKSALARRLKIHRSQLDAFLNQPGAPAPDARRLYDVKAVAAFIAEQHGGGGLNELRKARLEEVRLRCEKLRRELALASHEVVALAEIDGAMEYLARRCQHNMRFQLEAVAAPKIVGLDIAPTRQLIREAVDLVCNAMVADWETWKTDYEKT